MSEMSELFETDYVAFPGHGHIEGGHALRVRLQGESAPEMVIDCSVPKDGEQWVCMMLDQARKPIPGSCVVRYAAEMAGWDYFEIRDAEGNELPDATVTLPFTLRLKYGWSGTGEDFEDWMYYDGPVDAPD